MSRHSSRVDIRPHRNRGATERQSAAVFVLALTLDVADTKLGRGERPYVHTFTGEERCAHGHGG
jgi:hypothetical protein